MAQGGNYNGTQPNNTSYIKNFVTGTPTSLWKLITYGVNTNNYSCSTIPANVITPASSLIDSVYIPGNLYVDGSIVNPSDVYLKDKIENLLTQAIDKWQGVFDKNTKIALSYSHLAICVSSLQNVKLFNSNLDVVDDAFEYLMSKSSKGEKGQFFTPRYVIDMAVK